MARLLSRNRSAERGASLVASAMLLSGCIVSMFSGEAPPDDEEDDDGPAGVVTTGVDSAGSTEPASSSSSPSGDADSTGVGTSGGSTSGEPEIPPSPNRGDCCEVAAGTGCGDAFVAECVCGVDPVCCTLSWDALCVDHVTERGCGSCGFGPASIDPFGCCDPHAAPGCDDDAVAQCVCAGDPYCCDVTWDDVCVDAVETTGCGVCLEPPPGDCCDVGLGSGCTDLAIEQCVCAVDPYCCDAHWDELCVDGAVGSCGACGGAQGESSGGSSGSSDDGAAAGSSTGRGSDDGADPY